MEIQIKIWREKKKNDSGNECPAKTAGAPGMLGHVKSNQIEKKSGNECPANLWHARPCQRPLGHAVASPPPASAPPVAAIHYHRWHHHS